MSEFLRALNNLTRIPLEPSIISDHPQVLVVSANSQTNKKMPRRNNDTSHILITDALHFPRYLPISALLASLFLNCAIYLPGLFSPLCIACACRS